MKRTGAGIIGLGFIGMRHLDALLRVSSSRVAAVCHTREDITRAVCEKYDIPRYYTDWREMLKDENVNCVHNCTPNALHDEINLAAIRAGKHVYSEKPLSQSAALAREATVLARKLGVAAGLNHQYRLNAAVCEMRARLKNGLAGQTLAVTGHYLQESASRATDWSRRMENTGIARALNDIGIHLTDTACFVLGQPIVEVMADVFSHYPQREGANGETYEVSTEDTAFVLARFADGTHGQFSVSKAANGHKNDLRLEVWGSEYSMTWEQEQPDRLTIGTKGIGSETVFMNPGLCQKETGEFITLPMGHVMGWADALYNAINSFYESIANGSYLNDSQPYCTFRDGFDGMAFVEACLISAKERRWTRVESF